MSRSRILSSLAAASLGVTLLGACSAESFTERVVEVGLEQSVEGGDDIDVDFDFDDDDGSGGFSISTEDGDFSIGIDEEAGSIAFATDDGERVINFDEEDGTVSVTTDAGEGFNLTTNVEIPDEWPGVIGLPQTLVAGSEKFSVVEIGNVATVISGDFEYATGDPFGEQAAAALQADGWTGNSAPSSDGGHLAMLQKDGASIQIVADPNFATVTYTQPIS